MTDIGKVIGTKGWRQGSVLRNEDGQTLATELGYEGGENPVAIVVSVPCEATLSIPCRKSSIPGRTDPFPCEGRCLNWLAKSIFGRVESRILRQAEGINLMQGMAQDVLAVTTDGSSS